MSYAALKTPGVYVKEISIFPPSVAQVPTAIPAFIGYTERHEDPINGDDLVLKPTKISSLVEFQLYFGSGPKFNFDANTSDCVELNASGQVTKAVNKQKYYMFDSLQMFYNNGGGECYIISVGKYKDDGSVLLGTEVPPAEMCGGLEVLKEFDEPTMIVFPDAVSLPNLEIHDLQQKALKQCNDLMDRVGVFDIPYAHDKASHEKKVKDFRDSIGMNNLKYGAAYTPWIKSNIRKQVHYSDLLGGIKISGGASDLSTLVKPGSPGEKELKDQIKILDDIAKDNKKIKESLNTYHGVGGSLKEVFDKALQVLLTKLSLADADNNAPTKADKVKHAADAFMNLIKLNADMVMFIDKFCSVDPATGFIPSKELLAFVLSLINYTSSNNPNGSGSQIFTQNLKSLTDWDASAVSTTGTKAKLTISDPVPKAILGFAPFLLADFKVIKVLAGTVERLFTNNDPADSTKRIENMRKAYPEIQKLFDYFSGIIESIKVFANSLEKAKEEIIIGMWPLYKSILESISNKLSVLPPSGAIAGVYARVDAERGVWKAPANVSVILAKGTTVNITDSIQESLNVDVDAGKSINAIRVFSGKGTMVWGARTLAGNDNEWRYVSVRRFFNMVEESVKKSTSWVVFEPNDANTWIKVKGMIENYLTVLWRDGALAGAKPEEAFRVYVGLNQTMTSIDILEGRLIIRIEMAVVRPTEFIVLEFAHMLQTS